MWVEAPLEITSNVLCLRNSIVQEFPFLDRIDLPAMRVREAGGQDVHDIKII